MEVQWGCAREDLLGSHGVGLFGSLGSLDLNPGDQQREAPDED